MSGQDDDRLKSDGELTLNEIAARAKALADFPPLMLDLWDAQSRVLREIRRREAGGDIDGWEPEPDACRRKGDPVAQALVCNIFGHRWEPMKVAMYTRWCLRCRRIGYTSANDRRFARTMARFETEKI